LELAKNKKKLFKIESKFGKYETMGHSKEFAKSHCCWDI
jgi:hypothetical protein